MSKQRRILVSFPLGGLDERVSFRQEPPYTTSDCLNVWPVEPIERRSRGGSRPGLGYAFDVITGLSDPVRMMSSMTISLGDGYFIESDTFPGSSLSSLWQASTGTGAADPAEIIPNWGAGINSYATKKSVESVKDMSGKLMTEDFADGIGYGLIQDAWVDMYIQPIDGNWASTYRVIHGAWPGDMDLEGYSSQLEFDPDAQTITYVDWVSDVRTVRGVGTFPSHDSTIGGWLRTYISYDGSDRRMTAFWQGNECTWDSEYSRYDAGTGQMYYNFEPGYYDMGFGFGVDIGEEDNFKAGIRAFRIQSFQTSNPALRDAGLVGGEGASYAVSNPLGNNTRSLFVMSAGGNLYKQVTHGRLEIVTTDLSLRSDVSLSAVQSGQKLYIADYGDMRVEVDSADVSGSTLDHSDIDDWTVFSISADDDVAIISNGTGSTTDGVYTIASVAAGAITLDSAPGDGTCSFRIERAPKVFDPSDSSLSILTATAGQVPIGCPLICRHLGRIVLGGQEESPHVWLASRQNDETDWDYSQTDDQRAVAGVSSNVGVPGKPLTALISHGDDYLIFGCRNEIWRLRGDPAVAQGLDALSYVNGIISKDAWCLTPFGELVFLSADGIFVLAPGGESTPQALSNMKIPAELRKVNPKEFEVQMEYDVVNDGIFLTLSPNNHYTASAWWIDWQSKTLWPLQYDSDHEPTSMLFLESTEAEESAVIFGCRDGAMRKHDRELENDTGTNFSSYVDIGPVPLAQDGTIGIIVSLDGVMDTESGSVTWGVYPALSYQATADATASSTGTWTGGLNSTVHAAGSGQAFRLKITGTAGSRWAFENAVVTTREGGRRRVA